MITPEAQQKGAEANRKAAEARDARVLELLEEGKTWAEVAEDLGVKPTSVGTIITRARRRAGVSARPYRRGDPTA